MMLFLVVSLIIYLTETMNMETNQNYNIYFVNEEENIIAKQGVNYGVRYLVDKMGISPNLKTFSVGNNDSIKLLEQLCNDYRESLDRSEFPHLVFDTTLHGVNSEAVKFFTAALGLPTVSSSFGRPEEFRLWSDMDQSQEKYMVHVPPPTYLMFNLLKDIILRQNMTNVVLFYDESFAMETVFSSTLRDLGIRNRISPIRQIVVQKTIKLLKSSDISNVFILGNLSNIQYVLEASEEHSLLRGHFSWYTITLEKGMLKCSNCLNARLVFISPMNAIAGKTNEQQYNLGEIFYFILFTTFYLSLSKSSMDSWKTENFLSCDIYNGSNTPKRKTIDLIKNIQDMDPNISKEICGTLLIPTGEKLHINFSMQLNIVEIRNEKIVESIRLGQWNYKSDIAELIIDKNDIFDEFAATYVFKVLVVEQKPFVFLDQSHPRGFNGYCIDLMDKISAILNITYTLKLASDNQFGEMDGNGDWNGLIKDLLQENADIGLGSIQVTAARENVIDFTMPFYEPVGLTILMKLFHTETSLNKFINVLETDVWLCILAAFFITSSLIWIFDLYSPESYRNCRDKYQNEDASKIFTFKESLWFCFTSMTPQGGGEIPKNLSGRIVATTWWLFAFIILASYTANLAAILTVSMLDNPVEDIDDLEKQYKIQYAPLNGSAAMEYFRRMARIEDIFYEAWKNLTLNDSLSEVERSKFAVWTYPISNKYTNIWSSMELAGMPKNLDEAVERIRLSVTPTDGFAFLGDATDCRYLELTNCDLQIIGEEFSSKPYAIAVRQGSPLKDRLNSAILKLMNRRELEQLKTKWWVNNPAKMDCEERENQYDGIGVKNIGGVFILILFGIGATSTVLVLEYYWFRHQKNLSGNVSRRIGNQEDDESTRPNFGRKRDPRDLRRRRLDIKMLMMEETNKLR